MGEICSTKHLIGAWHAPKNFVSQIVSRDHKARGTGSVYLGHGTRPPGSLVTIMYCPSIRMFKKGNFVENKASNI